MRTLKAIYIFIKWISYCFGSMEEPAESVLSLSEFLDLNGWEQNPYFAFKKLLKSKNRINEEIINCRYFFKDQDKKYLEKAISHLERKGYSFYGYMQPINPGHYGLIEFPGRTELTICLTQK